ncbi:MAG TPA: aspartate carbamoyltransferase [Patescibacteria group bacterium]|nr:aspartate carbamoyltransferase [Patescibacteria group bacterium]
MKHQTLYQSDILSTSQFTKEDIEVIIERTRQMQELVQTKGASDLLHGKLMTALFYEPSSRTFGSFIASMQRLGGGFIPLQGVVYSSVAKGETLEDTVRTFASYSDVIVVRHPEVGAADIAAAATEKPVINAGDGTGEHPTQALLDFYTIHNHFGSLSGLTITFVGDMLNGRTIHSLSTLLRLYRPKKINFVSPPELMIPKEFVTVLNDQGIVTQETAVLNDVLSDTDVLYVTRVQKERFTDLKTYERLKHRFIINRGIMGKLKKSAILMHPLPRVGEIAPDVDTDPRALYLREQMQNGMYVRMALLSLVLKK